MSDPVENLVIRLFEVGAIKYNDMSCDDIGNVTHFTFNLKMISSYPDIKGMIRELLCKLITTVANTCNHSSNYVVTCTSLLADLNSNNSLQKTVLVKDPAKSYINGYSRQSFSGRHCILVSDVVTDENDILKYCEELKSNDGFYLPKHVVVIFNAEEKAKEFLKHKNISLHELLTSSRVDEILIKANKINDEKLQESMKLAYTCSQIMDLYDTNVIEPKDVIKNWEEESAIRFNFGKLISNPSIMNDTEIEFDIVCASSPPAVPMATFIALQLKKPLLIRNKEVNQNCVKIFEGEKEKGKKCLIIHDILISGKTITETTKDLDKEGLTASSAVVILDSEQDGKENAKKRNIKVFEYLTLSTVLKVLLARNKINEEFANKVTKNNRTEPLVVSLYETAGLRFRSAVTRKEDEPPVYFDFTRIHSQPKLMNKLYTMLFDVIMATDKEFNRICTPSNSMLPLVMSISMNSNKPVLPILGSENQELKIYVDESVQRGEKCIIVDDVLTDGNRIAEIAEDLKKEGLAVKNVFTLLDRESGGVKSLEDEEIKVTALFTITEARKILLKVKKIKVSNN